MRRVTFFGAKVLLLWQRPVQSAIRSYPRRTVEAALLFGKSRRQAFFLVMLPGIRRSLAAGLILAFGRSLGAL